MDVRLYGWRFLGGVIAAAFIGVSSPCAADGSPRRFDDHTYGSSVRTGAAASTSGRTRYPLRTHREALPNDTSLRMRASTSERAASALQTHIGAASSESGHARGSRALRHGTSTGAIRVFDRASVPESLSSIVESRARDAKHDVGSWNSRATVETDAASSSAGHVETSETLNEQVGQTSSEHDQALTAVRHRRLAAELSREDIRTGLRHGSSASEIAQHERLTSSERLHLRFGTDDATTNGESRVRLAESRIATQTDRRALSRIGAAYRSQSAAIRSQTSETGTGMSAVALTASARVNQSVSTASTFVVLNVQNTGLSTVRSPVVRLMLPANVKFEGLALAPPGAAAAVVETAEGQAVDVVLPLRMPAGHKSRAMVYLSPADAVRAEELQVRAFPMGQDTLGDVEVVGGASTPLAVGSSAVGGTSKDP